MERTGRPTRVGRLSVSFHSRGQVDRPASVACLSRFTPTAPPLHRWGAEGGSGCRVALTGWAIGVTPAVRSSALLAEPPAIPPEVRRHGDSREAGPGAFPPALPTLGTLQGLKGRLPQLRCGGRAAQIGRARAYASLLRAVFCSGVCPQTQHHRGGGLRGRPRSPCPPCVPCRARKTVRSVVLSHQSWCVGQL